MENKVLLITNMPAPYQVQLFDEIYKSNPEEITKIEGIDENTAK